MLIYKSKAKAKVITLKQKEVFIMNAELLEEINELIDNGAGMIEVFEYIQDNTDEDATKYIKHIKALM